MLTPSFSFSRSGGASHQPSSRSWIDRVCLWLCLCRRCRRKRSLQGQAKSSLRNDGRHGRPLRLPTAARSARFSCGLGALDFMKRTSILKYAGANECPRSARPPSRSARTRGLDAHARSRRSTSQPLSDAGKVPKRFCELIWAPRCSNRSRFMDLDQNDPIHHRSTRPRPTAKNRIMPGAPSPR